MEDPTPTPYSANILANFEAKLKKWKRLAACKRHFYHVDACKAWMEQTEANEKHSNTELLLRALEPKVRESQIFLLPENKILHGHRPCVIVFAILLEQGFGELIDMFRNAEIVDQTFRQTHWKATYYNRLRDELSRAGVGNSESIIKRFEDAKWAFCPAPLALDMEGSFEEGHWILPFCRRKVVNPKGGTASVDQVTVQKEFVPEELRTVLHRAAYRDAKFGEVNLTPKLLAPLSLISSVLN
jgi:hypothetical protein